MKKIIGILIVMLLSTPVFSVVATTTFNKVKDLLPCPILIPDQKQKDYGDKGWFLHRNQMVAQSFKPTKNTLSKVDLFISKQGENPEYGITVSIRDNLEDGVDLTSKSINYYWEDKTYDWISFDFHDIKVETGNTYFIIAKTECDDDNCYGWICAEDDEAYPEGTVYISTDNELNWVKPTPPSNTPRDCCFITYSPLVKSSYRSSYGSNERIGKILEQHPNLFPLLQQLLLKL